MTDKLICYSFKKKDLDDFTRSLCTRWNSMMMRCYNSNRENYARYGGRGIKVCDEWHNIRAFADWCRISGYKKELQLDRIDNNGNYCPENCKWVSAKENSQNCRRTRFLIIGEDKKAISEWARISGISCFTIYWWMNKKGNEYAVSRIIKKIKEITEPKEE